MLFPLLGVLVGAGLGGTTVGLFVLLDIGDLSAGSEYLKLLVAAARKPTAVVVGPLGWFVGTATGQL